MWPTANGGRGGIWTCRYRRGDHAEAYGVVRLKCARSLTVPLHLLGFLEYERNKGHILLYERVNNGFLCIFRNNLKNRFDIYNIFNIL